MLKVSINPIFQIKSRAITALAHAYKMQHDSKDGNHFQLIRLDFTVYVVTFKVES